MWYSHIMTYSIVIKMTELLLHSIIEMNYKNKMLKKKARHKNVHTYNLILIISS